MRGLVDETVSRIGPLDQQAMAQCQIRLDNLIKPLNSLGAFEQLACQLAGVLGIARPQMPPCKLILAGAGGSRPHAMTQVFAAHVGAGIVHLELDTAGTNSALTMNPALAAGIHRVRREIDGGSRVIGVGVLAPGESVGPLLAAWVMGADSLEQLADKAGPAILGVSGVILGAAAAGALVVLDDAATYVAALIAAELAPGVKDYLVGSHAVPGAPAAARLLGLSTFLDVDLSLGEGTGAALGISLLQASMHVLNDMRTFGETEVPVAEDGPGALVQNNLERT